MEALLLRYGYGLLFLGVMVEGEAFLVGGALLAHRGVLALGLVVLVAVVANSVADLAYYLLARARGRVWIERRYGEHPRYRRLVELTGRHGPWMLLASRFAYGFRILIPAACGALGMPPRAFVPVDLLAGTLWAVPVALLGYFAAGALSSTLAELQHHELAAVVLVAAVPLALVAARQARRLFPTRELRLADLHALAPLLVGVMGLVNIAAAVRPRPSALVTDLELWLPLAVQQRSRPLMLFAGLALLQVTSSLARRKALAWWVAVAALGVSLVSHAGHGLDLHHSLVAALLIAYLVVYRRRFNALSDPASLRRALAAAPLIAALIVGYGYLGLGHLRTEFDWTPGATPLGQAVVAGILIDDTAIEPATERAARFLGSVEIAGWLGRLYLLVLVLSPVILRGRQEAPADRLLALFREHGTRSLAAFAVQADKHHLLLAGDRALVAYAVRGSVAIACGDPLAPEAAFEAAAAQYFDHCQRHGWIGCVYEAAEDHLPVYRRLGHGSLKMAEEALLDLPEWNLAGGKRAALRSMASKVRKMGLVVRPYPRAQRADALLDEQLEEISEQWLAEKRLGELGFSLGRFSLESLDHTECFVCLEGERVLAFCTWLPYHGGRAVVVDLMRKRRDAVSGTMDFLLSEALLALRDRGYREASLANAPLANVGGPRDAMERGVALLFERLNAFYGYKNLFQFKKKFAPRWEGRYLVYPRGADLPRIALALTDLHGSGGLRRLLSSR